jgi:LysM repeat protein
MIEIIYNETKKGSGEIDDIFHIPNNIRQIGESREHLKIYMEDYAYTFLKRMSRQDTESGCAAVLLGEARWKDSVSYIFIRSALKIEEPDISAEHMPFSDAVWSNIHKDMEKYFPDQEVIGWSLSLPGFNMKMNDIMLRSHLDHFAGNQKVLFVMEPGEKEEAFFLYENSQMAKQGGYYIYYEKNEMMQNYMIEVGGNSSIEETEHVSDKAVTDFRKIVSGKKAPQSQGLSKRLLYGVSACSLIALLAFSISFFNDYGTMEETVSKLSGESQEVDGDDVFEEASQEVSGQKGITVKETSKPTQTPAVSETPEPTPGEEDSEEDLMIQRGSNNTNRELEDDPLSSMDETTDEDQDTSSQVGEDQDPTSTPQPTVAPDTSVKSTDGVVIPFQRYVVKRGDTLTQISEDYYGTIQRLEDICETNNLSPEDVIYAGQVIVLP